MRKKLSIAIITTSLSLVGCSTTYTDVLKQKLEEKSDQEKRIILAQECKNKINEYQKPNSTKSIQHSENMKEICEDMTGKKINIK